MKPPIFLVRWRERRACVRREATTLITFLGDMAYDEARARARTCRTKRDGQGDRLWSAVAVRIAEQTGREIGVKVADRYERERTAQGRAQARLEHEVAFATRSILAALAEIARGRNVQTELHNASAHICNAQALVASDAAVAEAGVALVRAATDLAAMAERSSRLVGQGLYPRELEVAGGSVERWRAALLKVVRRR